MNKVKVKMREIGEQYYYYHSDAESTDNRKNRSWGGMEWALQRCETNG